MSTEVSAAPAVVPELVWVGDGGWVASDPSMADDDSGRVVAYLEHKDGRVWVLWVRERRDVSVYRTLREALTEVALACDHSSDAVPAA